MVDMNYVLAGERVSLHILGAIYMIAGRINAYSKVEYNGIHCDWD